MRQKADDMLRHALLALLMGAGLILSLFNALGLSSEIPGALGILALSVLALTLAPRRKILLTALAAVLGVLFCFWLFRLNGLSVLSDVSIALMLTMTGIQGALPLFARETAVLLALLLAFLAYAGTSESVGCEIGFSCILILLAIAWATGKPVLILCMMPGVAAVLILFMRTGVPSIRLRTALPLAFALTALSFLLIPQGGVTVGPLKDAADSIRQRIQDYLFYTEPREVFSLASEGYYPNGSSQLGGTAHPDDHLVMVVKTPFSVYLRGTAKNEYTGRSWNDTTGGRRYLWVSPRWLSIRSSVFNQVLPSAPLSDSPLLQSRSISVQMVSASASDLFVPQRVRDLNCSGDIVPYFNQASEVFATRSLVAGDAWTVLAPLPVLGQDQLDSLIRQCAELVEDPAYKDIVSVYTRLPSHLSGQLYDLARNITDGISSAYDQVLAIAEYLRTHCRYSLEVDPVPDQVDFVSYFLLQTQEGYCTYFASAMTVLCRMVGLPARYIEGFRVTPSASETTYVTGHEGHAWTEVYFPGFGWLTVDATPGESSASGNQATAPSSSRNPDDTQQTPQPSSSPQSTPQPTASSVPTPSPSPTAQAPENTSAPTSEPQTEHQQSQSNGSSFPWFWLLLVLMVAAVALRIFLTLPEQRCRREKDALGVWLVWVHEILAILHVLRLDKQASETPSAFWERVDRFGAVSTPLSPLSDCASAVFYGHELPVEQDLLLYKTTAQDLYQHLSVWKKLQLILYRILPRPSLL